MKRDASFVIVRKSDGQAVMETFSARVAERVNKDKYEAVPILDYLEQLNAKIKAEAA